MKKLNSIIALIMFLCSGIYIVNGENNLLNINNSFDCLAPPFIGNINFNNADEKQEKVQEFGFVTAASEKGRRDSQEDRFIDEIINIRELPHGKGRLMAVMDGTGGKDVAQRVANEIKQIFEEQLLKYNGNKIKQVLQETVNQLHHRTKYFKKQGTTLSIVYVPADELKAYVAVLGDSPVIILDRDGNINISPQHNTMHNDDEWQRVRKIGGVPEQPEQIRKVQIIQGTKNICYIDPKYKRRFSNTANTLFMNVSRMLGNKQFGKYLSTEADIYDVNLGPDSFIVLSSDGLLHRTLGLYGSHEINRKIKIVTADFTFCRFLSSKELILLNRLIKRIQEGATASMLVKEAIKDSSTDNVTAIVYKAKDSKFKEDSIKLVKIKHLFQEKHFKTTELYQHIVDELDLRDKIGAEIGRGGCTFECEALIRAGMRKMYMVDNVRKKLPKRADLPDRRIVPKYGNAKKLPFNDESLDLVHFDDSLPDIALENRLFESVSPAQSQSFIRNAGPNEFQEGIKKPLEEAWRVLKPEGHLVILFESTFGIDNTQMMVEILLHNIESFGFQIKWIVKNNKLGLRGPVLISVKKILTEKVEKVEKLIAGKQTTKEITSAN